MQVVYTITLAMVTAAGLLTLVRVVRGPSELDRVVALDVLVVLIVTAVTVEVARLQEGFNLALLGSVALLGFLGAATAARLVELRGPPTPRPPRSSPPASDPPRPSPRWPSRLWSGLGRSVRRRPGPGR